MPGETLDDALAASRALGVGTVLTHLGENLQNAAEAEQVARHYAEALERIAKEALDVEISVKLTQLGLDFSREDCERHSDRSDRARGRSPELDLDRHGVDGLHRGHARHLPPRPRAVREHGSLRAVVSLSDRGRRRKADRARSGRAARQGRYREPPDKAFPEKKDVDASYDRLAARLLSDEARAKGVRAIFGTHDPERIGRIEELGRSRGLPAGALEFQLLYGIRRQEQLRLQRAGYRFRVLISYGRAWFA